MSDEDKAPINWREKALIRERYQRLALRALASDDGAMMGEAIKAGMSPNHAMSPDDQAMTVLMVAALQGRRECVKALLRAGARMDSGDENEWSALHWAASCREGSGALEELIAAGANVGAKAFGGLSPLMVAARNGNEDSVKALLSAGADPAERLEFGAGSGETAAMMARRMRHEELARWMEGQLRSIEEKALLEQKATTAGAARAERKSGRM